MFTVIQEDVIFLTISWWIGIELICYFVLHYLYVENVNISNINSIFFSLMQKYKLNAKNYLNTVSFSL